MPIRLIPFFVYSYLVLGSDIVCIQSITVIGEVYMVVNMIRIVALLYLSISIEHDIVVLRCAADIVLNHMI